MSSGTSDHQRRRDMVMTGIGDGVALFASAPETIRTHDSEHPYRQNTDFYYLTGFDEPQSVLILAPSHPEIRSCLFVRRKDKQQEIWNGQRLGLKEAKRLSGVDAAYPIEELDQRIDSFLETGDLLYYAFDADKSLNDQVVARLMRYRRSRARSGRGPRGVLDPGPLVHELRLRKSPADVVGMKRAVDVSAEGHLAAMRYARPGMREYEIEAIVEYVFTSRGAQSPAYPSIVASGANLTTIHYSTNRERVPNGSLVLVDAGAEVDYYCGDLTRTFPISGTFSPEQRAIYEIVLASNLKAIETCKPGKTFNADVNDAAARVLVDGLLHLGLLAGSAQEHLEKETHKRFTIHRIGHWLGMDTHDVGSYRVNGDWRPLEPGMVVTIEPGLYIPAEPDIDERFRGIAVRIEDDVLITPSGHDVLSARLAKSIPDVEEVIAQGRASGSALFA
ncbi:MAG: Xaa-Pro aminopeptidase [Candidatus Eremiobacter antarcticus]|nr:aminopeptidase P N-terminal domain-containing protein [Candidatus Eremiobacteraeota bacterium]MBC5807023.1 aminopeptidase P N-terminal domain-containing protein [Candidatus Eremiobacteraeota bacterium]PZR62845.1 MAG: Xaa-Pro aminopeptidase [Candidatus Eremiobacter sp. RRmetagenome_bin22]